MESNQRTTANRLQCHNRIQNENRIASYKDIQRVGLTERKVGIRRVGAVARAVCSIVLAVALIISSLPMSFAVVIGQKTGGENIELNEVRFILNHRGFDFNGGYLELAGKYLQDIPVYVRISGEAQPIGTRMVNTDELLIIKLTQEEIQRFSGEILVQGKSINLDINNFPNIQSADKASVIIDNTPPDSITFSGSNLHLITGTIQGIYGAGTDLSGQLTGTGSVISSDGRTIKLTNPKPPGRKGYQDIYIRKVSPATPTMPEIRVEYQYIDAFRILEKMDSGNVTMFPNTGSKGDELYLESKDFNSANIYEVYFLKNLNGSDRPNAVNKAKVVSLGINVDGAPPTGGKDILTIKVPEHKDFQAGTYYVLLTKIQNGQIIAEAPVKVSAAPGAPEDTFAVIQAGFGPKIVAIHPPKGPDTGSRVEIKAKNIITLNIPDLEGAETATPEIQSANMADKLDIAYKNTATPLKYKGKAVDVTRDIRITIGKKASFLTENIIHGVQDQFLIMTKQVDDAEADPKRDVIVEIETVIQEKDIPTNKYIFKQQVVLKDGYEFIPSTYIPIVDTVTPNVIQTEKIQKTGTDYYKTDKKILVSIKGEKFFVYRYFDTDGNPIAVKPSIFIKQESGNTLTTHYQIALLPNAAGNKIYYSTGNDAHTKEALMIDGPSGSASAPLNVTVLDKDGRVVDGTEGNQLGTNLMVELPEGLLIRNSGSMHIQVTNPLRGRPDGIGGTGLFVDKIEFRVATDTPIIEKVEPNVVTTEGGDDIVLTGSNIVADAKLYIDGNEMTGVQREIDPTGNKVLLKFESPKNREAITQLLVQNPGGGMAVTDFTFIKSFDKDPKIDSFAPPSGTYGTLVVVAGDNYLKPDPTAVKQDGVDAYRLIGTRVQLDGRDVDVFKKESGNITFTKYTAPKAEALIKVDAGLAVYSKLYQNSTVKYNDGVFEKVASLEYDAERNPLIVAGDRQFSIRYDKANSTGGTKKFRAYTADGKDAGEAVIAFTADAADDKKGRTTISIAGAGDIAPMTFTAEQDNHVLRIGTSTDGIETVFLANYAESVTFRDNVGSLGADPTVRYTLTENFEGQAILTNGKDKTYTLRVTGDAVKKIQGVSTTGAVVDIVPTNDGLTIGGAPVAMITPYAEEEGIITGHVSKVVSRTQILFEVPVLQSGRGYKDLVVINPDTKRDSKLGEEGFYYIPQASSKPVISTVAPKKGSVDGGYYVTIFGSDFGDEARVFVDGVEVPEKDVNVALNGRSIIIRMVPTEKKLAEDYGVDHLTVPVVVLNPDGGTAGKKDGFTYIIPKSSPVINKIIPEKGSSNGNEIVEISGYEFRFYEPYTNLVGDPGYQDGDKHEDLFQDGVWDELFDEVVQKRLEKLVVLMDFKESDRKKDIFSANDWSLVLSAADMTVIGQLKTLQTAGNTGTTEFNTKFDRILNGLYSKSPIVPKRLYNNAFYRYTYESVVLPKIYFGEYEAKVVEFTRGYIKVLTPSQKPGKVGVYLINNDSGVSNKVEYTYETTKPIIEKLIPPFGSKGGSEPKELFGKKMFPAKPVYGYVTDNGAEEIPRFELIEHMDSVVRFGEIDNLEIPRIEPNSGLINNQRTTVELEGGLTLQYFGDLEKIRLSLNERNTIFKRDFAYDESKILSEDKAIYIPVGMLKDANGNYYVPTGLMKASVYTSNPRQYKQPYEYIKVYIDDKRMMVERGYAPKVIYENEHHVTAYTPSYHSIGKVKMTFFNPDGGQISRDFEFTNPASEPKILKIEPQVLSHDETQWYVESSVLGGIDIEVIGHDFRAGMKVNIGDKTADVKEITKKAVDGKSYDVAVVTVPKGSDSEIGIGYPIILENEDKGLATSNNLEDLIGPNHNNKTLPFYFVYRKPLSFPSIESITPHYTSVAGGNPMVVTGKDFRSGAYIIIGTRAGIPIYNGVISEQGRKISFQTPKNMTLGEKDLQVLNTDYGTGVAKSAIHVVSAPTVHPDVYAEDGITSINRIHVTGGQKVTIKGTGFSEGAMVYFGGEWVLAAQNPENKPGTDEGLYTNDKLYMVKGGEKAKEVEFVDSETLRVTTPAVDKEGEISIVVLNKDGGISDDSAKLEYRVPIPSDPRGLKATIVENRYIKLYDYVSPEAKYFEIYVYIGGKSSKDLIQAKYQDFTYLGVTDVEPYKITELPGWEKMKKTDRAVFVLRAVNKFGQSGFSNLAYLEKKDFEKVVELGPEDIDGEFGVPEDKDFVVHEGRTVYEIVFGTKLSKPMIELKKSEVDTKKRKVSVPEELVKNQNRIIVSFADSALAFTPQAFRVKAFDEMDKFYHVYGNIVEEKDVNAPNPHIRGKRVIGGVRRLSFSVSSNQGEREIPALGREIGYSIKVPDYVKDPSRVALYRYDEKSGKYIKTDASYNAANRFFTVKNTNGGYFVLIESK